MDHYEELFEISKLLLAEDDAERTPEILLRRLVERCGAETGFVVVREDGSFQQSFEVGYERDRRSDVERRFSRTLVREAIASGELLYLPNLIEDSRFASGESGLAPGRCCVLVGPPRHGGEGDGVGYLHNRQRVDSFDAESRAFLAAFAEVAGLFLLRASEREALRRRNRSLENDLFSQHDFAGIVTRDPRLIELLRVVAQVAGADAPILVLGETGTGKELIARALHVNSPRRGRPFVTVHCAALPGTLLESELFGHVAGAFTDAKRDRPGRLAAAHGGTLFLDEVGEIPIEAQAKLLRFLQFGEIQRLGSDRTEKVAGRGVAATHRHLRQLAGGGGGGAGRGGHQPRPPAVGGGGKVPGGPVLPAQGARSEAAAAARAPGGRPAAGRPLPAPLLAAGRGAAALDAAGRARPAGPRVSGQRPRAGPRRGAGLPAGPRSGAGRRSAAAGAGGRGARSG